MVGRVGGAATYPQTCHVDFGPPAAPSDVPFLVGVIDTGLALHDGEPHDFLRGHVTATGPGWEDHLPAAGLPLDRYDGHGTFVAGLILRAAPTVTISMANVLDEQVAAGQDDAVARAIDRLTEASNLRLVNLSFFGGQVDERSEPPEIRQALQRLFAAHEDVIVVTSAGNSAANARAWPAAFSQRFDRVVSVGAVDESVIPERGGVPPKASFSNFGTWVDAYASGVQVVGPYVWHSESRGADGGPGQVFAGSCRWSGTSFAAAAVTGQLARTMIDQHLDARQARDWLLRGPMVATPGVPEEHWRPWVRTRDTSEGWG